MVKAKFVYGDYGAESFKITDHAGDEIICAGASAIGWSLAGTLLNLDPRPNIKKMVTEDGIIEIELDPFADEQDSRVLDAVFLTGVIGLRQLEKAYPDNIKVEVIHL